MLDMAGDGLDVVDEDEVMVGAFMIEEFDVVEGSGVSIEDMFAGIALNGTG